MRIAPLLHTAYNRKGSDFVVEMYNQLLNREPDEEEIIGRVSELEGGVSKYEMMAGVMISAEAKELYEQLPDGNVESAADKIQYMLQTNDAETFLNMLYAEVLCRFAEDEEYTSHLCALEQGADPIGIVYAFLLSDEFWMLLESDRSCIDRRMLLIFMTSR